MAKSTLEEIVVFWYKESYPGSVEEILKGKNPEYHLDDILRTTICTQADIINDMKTETETIIDFGLLEDLFLDFCNTVSWSTVARMLKRDT